jgi:AraC-like DNA-binding protein
MSVHVSSLVYSRLFGGASIKLVALKLADHANDDGGSIYPSIARVAAECELSERQVQRILRDMVSRGLLRVDGDAKGGRGHPTRYSFHMVSLSALPSSFVPKGDTHVTRTINRTISRTNPP